MADGNAKWTAEAPHDRVEPEYQGEASFPPLLAYYVPFGVCFLVFANPLHEARRAMAAALFSPPFKDQVLSPTTMGHTGEPLSPPPHHPPNKGEDIEKTKERDKGKIQSRAGPARPPRLPTLARHSPYHPLSP